MVQETFTLERHGEGHLLRHRGTGGYVCVAAEGLKVAVRRGSAGPTGRRGPGSPGCCADGTTLATVAVPPTGGPAPLRLARLGFSG